MRGKISIDKLRQIHPVEDLLFKRRTLFEADRTVYELRDPDNDRYEVSRFGGTTSASEIGEAALQFLQNHIGAETTNRRLQLENCTLYLARGGENSDPAGFYWGVHAENVAVWHDSYRVAPRNGLVFNAYVAPPHRRQGVYRLLQTASHNHLLDEIGCDRVITIVEDRNKASILANEEFGLRKKGKNYLVKLLSVNILSIIKTTRGTQMHFVLPKGGL